MVPNPILTHLIGGPLVMHDSVETQKERCQLTSLQEFKQYGLRNGGG